MEKTVKNNPEDEAYKAENMDYIQVWVDGKPIQTYWEKLLIYGLCTLNNKKSINNGRNANKNNR